MNYQSPGVALCLRRRRVARTVYETATPRLSRVLLLLCILPPLVRLWRQTINPISYISCRQSQKADRETVHMLSRALGRCTRCSLAFKIQTAIQHSKHTYICIG